MNLMRLFSQVDGKNTVTARMTTDSQDAERSRSRACARLLLGRTKRPRTTQLSTGMRGTSIKAVTPKPECLLWGPWDLQRGGSITGHRDFRFGLRPRCPLAVYRE